MTIEDLADAARARRDQLGLTQSQLEAAQGPTLGTIRNIEQGNRPDYTSRSLAAIDRGLGWQPGSASELLHHGTPPVVVGPATPDRSTEDERALRIGRLVMRLAAELHREFGSSR